MNWKKIGIFALLAFLLLMWADPHTAASMVSGTASTAKDFLVSSKTFASALFN